MPGMRSPRGNRFRPLLLLALLILTIIYLTTGPRSTQTSEFYTRTVAAVDARQKALREGLGAMGPASPAEDKAARAQQAAEAKVRDGEGEIRFPAVKDHEGGKGERVSGKEKEDDVEGGGKGGQKPIVDKEDIKAEVEKAKGKAKDVADKIVGKTGKKAETKADEAGAKDYSGRGGHKEDSGTTKEGAKEYSGKGGHKEDDAPKEGAMKYHGKAGEDEEETDAVHGPKDTDKGSSKSGKKVQGKTGEDDGVAKVGNTGKHVQDETKKGSKAVKDDDDEAETTKDHDTEVILDGILKKSPIIIFSKSYCRFSAKAKRILLEGYKIVPAPYVEELDQHPQGDKLQAVLQRKTGRRTVPNVLINGISIGGGDDVEALDEAEKLASKIMELGGKRIMEVKKVGSKA